MKIWPNNVTARDRRDVIAHGSSNPVSPERSEGQGGSYSSASWLGLEFLKKD